MQVLLIVVGVVVTLGALGWLGLQIQPAPFTAFPQKTGEIKTIPLPKGLPAPVERFYRTMYGDNIPVITSAVITGRATIRPVGQITFPARYRFSYIAGQAYRHYIETTFFGLPVITANEHYIDGKGKMEISIMGTDEGDKYDQAANLGMWAEFSAFPSIYLTDPRVRWEPIDDETALLVVPFKNEQQRFVVRFDAATGLMSWMEAMRYHTSQSESKVLWLAGSAEWGTRDGKPFATKGTATWMDDGKPWAVLMPEEVIYNVDAQEYIRQKSP